jgi:uncharacterized membrane protein YphA (DoxX/SURF4 family)
MKNHYQVGPVWVNQMLDSKWSWLIARVALTSAYLVGGLIKLSDFPAAIAEQEHFGLQPAWLYAALVITVELVSSILIILGRWVWLAAGALGVFTALATLIAHAFWTMQGQERFVSTAAFFEHIGLIAGMVMVAMIDLRKRRAHDER